EQPQRTKTGQPSGLGHQQPERLDAASLGGSLEQAPHRIGRDLELELPQGTLRQPEFTQQTMGIEAGLAGDLGVIGQSRAADRTAHGAAPSRKDKSMSRGANPQMRCFSTIGP